jgi:hypothetical protein
MNFSERLRGLLRAPIATVVALASGALVLFSYIVPGALDGPRNILLGWIGLLSAAAVIVGALNLVSVHFGKISRAENPIYSLALVITMAITFGLTVFFGPQSGPALWIFRYIQIPIEASLMAVLSVTLTFSAARLVAQRANVYSLLFIGFALLTLLGAGPVFLTELPIFSDALHPWLTGVLAGGGARGILLGVSLGTITTGLRVLVGAERPYGG